MWSDIFNLNNTWLIKFLSRENSGILIHDFDPCKKSWSVLKQLKVGTHRGLVPVTSTLGGPCPFMWNAKFYGKIKLREPNLVPGTSATKSNWFKFVEQNPLTCPLKFLKSLCVNSWRTSPRNPNKKLTNYWSRQKTPRNSLHGLSQDGASVWRRCWYRSSRY